MKENTAVLHVQVPVDVATYLLNEKRAEIHAIEARLKVNVVLIPNVYFETPNYSITRLRHDDVKLGEVQASYQKVEKPAQEVALPSAGPETKPVRQQAAVRGITPSQPAPIREQRLHQQPEPPSFLDKIFGWFKQIGGEEKVRPEQAASPAAGPERGRARRDRGDRGDRGDRAGRSVEASGAAAHAAEASSQRVEKRGEPKLQGERTAQKKQPRPPREEKIRSEAKLPGSEEQLAAEEAPQHEDTSRRRRRGGRQRERGDRPDRASRENKQMAAQHSHPQQPASQATSQSAHEEKHAESPAPGPVLTAAQETPALVLTSSPQIVEAPVESGISSFPHPETPQVHETLPSTAPMMLAMVSEAPEIPGNALPGQPPADLLVEETTAEELTSSPTSAATIAAQVEVSGTDKEAIDTMPASRRQDIQQPQPSHVIEVPDPVTNGLIMIETIPEKIKPGEIEASAESTLPRRRKRPPVLPAVTHEEPMVQIETHK